MDGLSRQKEIITFFKEEGIAALFEPGRFPNGILLAQGFYESDLNLNVPAFVLVREQYARIVRLIERNIAVKIELNLQTKSHDDPTGANVIAEIPGQDYFGSLGYVKKHHGDPKTMCMLPEHEKLSVYYNLDEGSGKIRGIYL